MTTEEIKAHLTQVFRTTFKNEGLEISPEMTADDVEGWDSITHLLLITEVEKGFEIEINGFDIMGLQNVGDLIALIDRKLTD